MLKNAFPFVLFLCIISFVKAAEEVSKNSYIFWDHAFEHTKQGKDQAMMDLVNQVAKMWQFPSKKGRKEANCESQCDKKFSWGSKYSNQLFRPITKAEHKLMHKNVPIGGSYVCILSGGIIKHIGPWQTQHDADRKTCFSCLMQAKKLAFKVRPKKKGKLSAIHVYPQDVKVALRTDSFIGKDWVSMGLFAFTFGLILLFYCQRRKEEADLYSPLADLEEVE